MARFKDMTEGSPSRLLIRFSVPLFFSNALQLGFTLADGAVVGRMLGVRAFASIGVTASLHWLVMSAVIGITQGFGTYLAQRFGAKDMNGLRRAFTTSAWLSAFFAVIFGILGFIGCESLLVLMKTPFELISGATVYLRFYFAGMPILFAYNLLSSTMFALGDSRTPLLAMIISTLVNIVLDVALAIPFGIAGIAIATPLAQLASCVFVATGLYKNGVLKGGDRRLDTPSIWPLLRLGLPLGFRNAVIEIGGLVVQRYVNGYGTEFVAGIAAAKRMYSLLLIAAGAIEAAVATFVAQNFGAKLFTRLKQGVRSGMLLMLAFAVIIMGITLPFGRWIINLLIEGDPDQVALVLDTGARQLSLLALGLPILYLLFLYRSALQGVGNTIIPMLSGFCELAMRIAAVVVVTPLLGEWGILLSDPAGWAAATVLLAISYYVVFRKFNKAEVFNEASIT